MAGSWAGLPPLKGTVRLRRLITLVAVQSEGWGAGVQDSLPWLWLQTPVQEPKREKWGVGRSGGGGAEGVGGGGEETLKSKEQGGKSRNQAEEMGKEKKKMEREEKAEEGLRETGTGGAGA